MKYVCLKSINSVHKFYSMCSEEELKLNVGDIIKYSEDVQYEILGFANTSEEAEKILYPDEQEFATVLMDYLRNMNNEYLEKMFCNSIMNGNN